MNTLAIVLLLSSTISIANSPGDDVNQAFGGVLKNPDNIRYTVSGSVVNISSCFIKVARNDSDICSQRSLPLHTFKRAIKEVILSDSKLHIPSLSKEEVESLKSNSRPNEKALEKVNDYIAKATENKKSYETNSSDNGCGDLVKKPFLFELLNQIIPCGQGGELKQRLNDCAAQPGAVVGNFRLLSRDEEGNEEFLEVVKPTDGTPSYGQIWKAPSPTRVTGASAMKECEKIKTSGGLSSFKASWSLASKEQFRDGVKNGLKSTFDIIGPASIWVNDVKSKELKIYEAKKEPMSDVLTSPSEEQSKSLKFGIQCVLGPVPAADFQ